ncbi:MAG: arylsulfatase [Draconibacterium sp.]|nr:arylsulfatase [Draconibacterium sp.]
MKLIQLSILILFAFTLTNCNSKPAPQAEAPKPNVVIIYIDDLGYGDVSCYGATEITTPNVDKLAGTGLLFTDAHCSSATCTPSRFSMLSGKYAFRQKGTGVARGDASMIIDPDTRTLGDIFKEAGYNTGVVGKWHLGLGPKEGPDWNGYLSPGPQDIGFDYSFLIPATGDRVPCVYVENGRVLGLDPADPIAVSFGKKIGNEPTGKENPELLKMNYSHGHNNKIINGISRIGFMTGGKSARWVDEYIGESITQKALGFIEKNDPKVSGKPFFLYFSTQDIHVPRVPGPSFVGKSGMGPRGDAILEMDWSTGEIMKKLENLGLTDNTIIIFTSDNGPVVDDGYQDQAVELLGKHKPAGPLRGGKYSAFDAGTRIPFIVTWPGKVAVGKSDALVSQIDFIHSFAKMFGLNLAENDAPDSFDMMDVILGKSKKGRDHVIEYGAAISIIKDNWKYIEPSNRPKMNKSTNTEMGTDPKPQLYNLSIDLGETKNVASEFPEKVKELQELLQKYKDSGRTRD